MKVGDLVLYKAKYILSDGKKGVVLGRTAGRWVEVYWFCTGKVTGELAAMLEVISENR